MIANILRGRIVNRAYALAAGIALVLTASAYGRVLHMDNVHAGSGCQVNSCYYVNTSCNQGNPSTGNPWCDVCNGWGDGACNSSSE